MTNSKLEIALAVFFVVGGFIWYCLGTQKSERQWIARLRTRAHAQFKNSKVDCADARYAFSGQTVRIVMDLERRQTREGYTSDVVLERYCMNASGEYFHFISNSEGRPYIRHVPHRMAKLVLKQHYVPPPSEAG
jgi:hypothetical protein